MICYSPWFLGLNTSSRIPPWSYCTLLQTGGTATIQLYVHLGITTLESTAESRPLFGIIVLEGTRKRDLHLAIIRSLALPGFGSTSYMQYFLHHRYRLAGHYCTMRAGRICVLQSRRAGSPDRDFRTPKIQAALQDVGDMHDSTYTR